MSVANRTPTSSDWTALTLLDSTSPVSTSMCDTVPSMKFAVQIAPAPKERNLTPTPASNVRRTGGRPGSIRHTTPSPSAVAQTWPAPTAMPERFWAPTGIFSRTRFVLGSIRVTARVSSALMNQTPSLPAAIVAASTTILATRLPLSGSIRETVRSSLIAQTAPAPTAT
jgi:hypothetical protein